MNMDVHTKKQRSFNMSRIKSKNTKPELVIFKILKDLKIDFKRHCKSLPGTPDFYIPSHNLIIDIRGCFWHGHKGCRYYKVPSSNREFWINKIESNQFRDHLTSQNLKKLKIKNLIIWECEIRNGRFLQKILFKI